MDSFRSTAAAFALIALTAFRASAAPVTSCGQVVAGAGVLTADLDCSAYADGPAITVSDDASLALAGYRLIGNPTQPAVRCEISCSVRGPGTIDGGLQSVRASDCSVRGLNITGAVEDSVYCWTGDIRKSTISGAGNHCAYGDSLRIARSSIFGCGRNGVDTETGLVASHVEVRDCGAVGMAVFTPTPFDKVRIRKCIMENNAASGFGIYQSHDPIRISDSIIRGNRHGIFGNTSFEVRGCEITGNDVAGIYIGGGLEIAKSTVTGNCQNWDPESWDNCCSDLHAEGGLEARDVTCGTSEGGVGPGCGPYGVCSMD
jgi:hypothetical protein